MRNQKYKGFLTYKSKIKAFMNMPYSKYVLTFLNEDGVLPELQVDSDEI
jgi:hypothetical protein